MVSRDAELTDEERLELQQERDRDERFAEVEHLRGMLDNQLNRAFFWRMLEQCGVYQNIFSPDLGTMALAEGKRQIGLWLIKEMLEVDPAVYVRMQNEARIRREQKERE